MPSIDAFSLFVIAVLVFAVVLVFTGVKSVPQGYEFTIERSASTSARCGPGST